MSTKMALPPVLSGLDSAFQAMRGPSPNASSPVMPKPSGDGGPMGAVPLGPPMNAMLKLFTGGPANTPPKTASNSPFGPFRAMQGGSRSAFLPFSF